MPVPNDREEHQRPGSAHARLLRLDVYPLDELRAFVDCLRDACHKASERAGYDATKYENLLARAEAELEQASARG